MSKYSLEFIELYFKIYVLNKLVNYITVDYDYEGISNDGKETPARIIINRVGRFNFSDTEEEQARACKLVNNYYSLIEEEK